VIAKQEENIMSAAFDELLAHTSPLCWHNASQRNCSVRRMADGNANDHLSFAAERRSLS
jgi:hypothetical protein